MRPCCTLLEENMASTVRGPNQLLDQLHAQCLGAALSVWTFEMRAVDLPATICSAVEWRQLGGAVAGAGRLSEGSYRVQRRGLPPTCVGREPSGSCRALFSTTEWPPALCRAPRPPARWP